MTTHRGVAAVQLHEERELEMLASLERLRKSGGSPRVSELAQALHSLDMCDGIDLETVERVILRTAAELGQSEASEVSHECCAAYYNGLVDWVSSHEGRLSEPSRNCTPQYTLCGLDLPHCFWINLDRVADRRASMRRLLRGYDHSRVPAVDATGEAWWEQCVPLGLGRPLRATAAERCCTMSHLAAFEAVRAAKAPLGLILEDDVTFKFVPPAFALAKVLAALPPDWEVLHVSARSNPPSRLLGIPHTFCEWRPKLCYSTAAYVVNGARIGAVIAKVRAALLTGVEARADWVIYGSCRTYVLTRPLIDEDPFRFRSAIHSENEDYHRLMHVALSELYHNEARRGLGLPPLPLSDTSKPRRKLSGPLPLLSLDDLRALRDGTLELPALKGAAPGGPEDAGQDEWGGAGAGAAGSGSAEDSTEDATSSESEASSGSAAGG